MSEWFSRQITNWMRCLIEMWNEINEKCHVKKRFENEKMKTDKQTKDDYKNEIKNVKRREIDIKCQVRSN